MLPGVIARNSRFVVLAALVGALASLSACGSKQQAGPDNIVVAGQRLQGNWRLTAFTPEATLDAPLQGLLQAQLGRMTVSFSGSNYTAAGTGFNVSGRFQIQSAEGDFFSSTFYDQTGVAYRTSGQFDGKLFRFHSYDAPWRGQGILERSPGALAMVIR
jgi:hypothetical protein